MMYSQYNCVPLSVIGYGITGIYLLIDEDKSVVYVGTSQNIGMRISQHIHQRMKHFTQIVFIPVADYTRQIIEGVLIAILKPKYNNRNEPLFHPSSLDEIKNDEWRRVLLGFPKFIQDQYKFSKRKKNIESPIKIKKPSRMNDRNEHFREEFHNHRRG